MNRRKALLALWSAGAAVSFTGCAAQSDVPATVATDAGLVSTGLAGAFKSVAAVPGAVVAALTDLASAAQALAGADTIASAQPLVQRIEADVNAVVAAVAVLPLPPQVSLAITAAQVLLVVIEAGVNLVVTASAAPRAMTPEAARLVLAGAAR